MDKKQAIEKIKKLAEKYENLPSAEKKKYNESMVCKDFILPLFQALGWDVYNNVGQEVTSEAQISGKRADYAFNVNGIIKFFIEAKKPSADLREEKMAEQAVFYAWHKSVPWAILTNFEVIKVFNAEWDETDVERSLIFEINFKDFLEDKRLWWLSKESMEKGELDKYAQENFKKPKREPVDKQLANDLVRWRTALFNDLKQWNSGKEYTDKVIAKAVQQLLDRFIFIRTTEDRQIEGERLRELVRNWEENKGKINLGDELKKLFASYNEDYDSRLFEPSGCDKLEYENSLFADIIRQLYKNKKGIRYDFSSINADVLGSIYEQYLGQIQKGEKAKSKRKSQGIYYTPRYIVDYIVRNTLGELLKGKSGQEASKLKILDPACGSGSFLIKAFEVLDNHVKRENNQQNAEKFINYARKVAILTSNIYGVDLDEEAVEIAQLNLLLKVLEQREKLPNLGHNIENGNSLISGTPKELEKYFGKEWKDKKPFNWEERFPDVFKKGGFDVIIGNPPYVGWAKGKQSREDKDYYEEKFKEIYTGKNDIFYYFIYNSLKKLNKNGRFCFIISRYFLESIYASKLRKFISSNFYIDSIVDFRETLVFEGVSVHTCIITIVNINKQNARVKIQLDNLNNAAFFINQNKLGEDIWRLSNAKENFIIDKIESNSNNITDFFDIKDTKLSALDGVYILSEKEIKKLGIEKKFIRKFISSKDINRYICNWGGKYLLDISKDTELPKNTELYKYLLSKKDLIEERNKKRKENLGWGLARPMVDYNWDGVKLFCPSRSQNSKFILDDSGATGSRHNVTVLFLKTNKNPLFFLAVLNSKLFNYYFKILSKKMGQSYEYLPQYLEKIRIKVDSIEKKKYDSLILLASNIIESNRELNKLNPILDKEEYEEKKAEIDKTDREIDQKVYALYGLSGEEIKTVEG